MKRKIFSIFFTLVLVCSFSLMTAVPAAAADGETVTLTTGTTGIAEWTTDQASSGNYSVYLHATEPNADSYGQVQLEVAPIAMAGFTGVSFNVWELESTVHGGEFPGAWNIPYPYGDPYIVIMLDTDSDGVGDDYLVGTASYTASETPAPQGVTHTGPLTEQWVEMAEGYGFRDSNASLNDLGTVFTEHEWYAGMVLIAERVPPGDVWRIHDVGTIAEWKTWFAANAPDVTVVGVRIQFGAWLDDPGEGVYVDDVTISGTTYDLEPSSSVGMTAEVLDITAISVTPTDIDFGTLKPGEASGPFDITVENVGTQTVDVDADVWGSGGTENLFYKNLQLRDFTTWSKRPWPLIVNDLAMGDSETLKTKLTVPSSYTPKGPESATLTFTAKVAE